MLILIFCNSCKNSSVIGREIRIEIRSEILDNSWIKIDGMSFFHYVTDTMLQASKISYTNNEYSPPDYLVSKYTDYTFIPASKMFKWNDFTKSWLQIERTNTEIVSDYIVEINRSQVETTGSSDLLDRIYEYSSTQIDMFNGIMVIKRRDDKPIKVSWSSNYNGIITVVE